MDYASSITFDIDWAPSWAVEECAALCVAAGVPATFFVTHEFECLPDLRSLDSIELGIHPNFLAGSSHGTDTKSVLATCMAMVPEARSMRTHGLHQSTAIFSSVLKDTPVEVDVSLFLPGHSHLSATDLFLDGVARALRRLPYFWEDDLAAATPKNDWAPSTNCAQSGLRIYDFHPIHIVLNTTDLSQYRSLKVHMGGRPLSDASRTDIEIFKNSERRGARDFFLTLLKTEAHFFKIIDIARSVSA